MARVTKVFCVGHNGRTTLTQAYTAAPNQKQQKTIAEVHFLSNKAGMLFTCVLGEK